MRQGGKRALEAWPTRGQWRHEIDLENGDIELKSSLADAADAWSYVLGLATGPERAAEPSVDARRTGRFLEGEAATGE